jgi:hypothetical protein
MKTEMKKLLKWLKELPYSKCDNCKKKGVYFYGEEHFGSGKNIYICKYCKTEFIIP